MSGFFPSILSERKVLFILAGCQEVERASNNKKAASFLKFIWQSSLLILPNELSHSKITILYFCFEFSIRILMSNSSEFSSCSWVLFWHVYLLCILQSSLDSREGNWILWRSGINLAASSDGDRLLFYGTALQQC